MMKNSRPTISSVFKGLIFMAIDIVCVPVSIGTAAQGPTAAEYSVALNLSGQQRMLTQKT